MWALLAAPIALASAGCFLVPSAPRPDPNAPIAGPVPYVENCQLCHATPVAAHYAMSLHTTKGIRCGQCHTPDGHPNFTQPVRTASAAAVTSRSTRRAWSARHFATRAAIAPGPRPGRAEGAARRGLHRARTGGGRRFVGDSSSGELGGRLCAACHYDEHRLDLAVVRRDGFCTSCHGARLGHFPLPVPEGTNRCLQCHVRVGTTENWSGGEPPPLRPPRKARGPDRERPGGVRRRSRPRHEPAAVPDPSGPRLERRVPHASPLGCGGAGRDRALAPRRRAPPFNPSSEQVVAKIIDGFNPPDTEIRERLEREDPGLRSVAAYAEFA